MTAKPRILVVDDEESPRESLRFILKDRYEVRTVPGGAEALEALRAEGTYDVVLLDIKMAGLSGIEVLPKMLELHPHLPVVMVTAITDARPAVQAMKMGAADYLNKPFDVAEIRLVVARIIEERQRDRQSGALQPPSPAACTFESIVGSSAAMQEVYALMRRVADTESSVLVLGETGTGKELVSRALHYSSSRRDGPFVPVHCAAIPGELLESELFGHEKGAFTGALQRRIGMFEAANGGTLFLDEIGEMPLATQAKLLRALQEREIRRVGSQDTIKINVRIVCSTNRDLEQEVKQGKFREDLFYRINVVPLVLPPLRDRREDIPLLVGHFTRTFAARQNRPPQEFNARAMELMQQYPWPGNVRELEHAVERVLVTTDANPIRPEHLPFVIANAQFETSQRPALATSGTLAAFATGNGGRSPDGVDLTLLTETVERQAIEQALQRSGGVITEAARLLNVTRRILRYKMDKLGIAPQALAKGEEDKSVP